MAKEVLKRRTGRKILIYMLRFSICYAEWENTYTKRTRLWLPQNRWNTLIKDSEIGDDTKKKLSASKIIWQIRSWHRILYGYSYNKIWPDSGDNAYTPLRNDDARQIRLSSIPIANIQKKDKDAYDLKLRKQLSSDNNPYRPAAGVESTFFGADSQIPSFGKNKFGINIGSVDVLGVPVSTLLTIHITMHCNKPQDVGFWKQLSRN